MKKVFTTLAIFMCMICGSVFLVSCSNNYKNMYLVVEYAVPNAEGGVEWIEVGANTSFDYVLSDSVKEGDNYVLYLRVQVKGTSKNVDSLFVSKSVNNSTDYSNTEKTMQTSKLYQDANTALNDLDIKTMNYLIEIRNYMPTMTYQRYLKKFQEYYNDLGLSGSIVDVK